MTLLCRNEIAGVILDRFGTDIMLIPAEEGHFRVHILVAVSPQFFGWLTGIGTGIRITGPKAVKEEYRKYLKGILEGYETERSE